MSYNLAEKSYIGTNLTVGNVNLTYQQINTLITTTVGDIEYLSGDNILCIDCDLGHRIDTAEIKYYFTSDLSKTVVASGIDFYYKNDEADVYTSLVTSINNDYYYSTVPGIGAPRYVRLTHTISGTSVSGTVNGFEIINDGSIVDFGEDGSLVQKNITTTIANGDQIETIPIYNDGTLISTVYISLEPQETDIDNGISISDSSGGPWISSLDPDEVFVSPSVLYQGDYVENTQNLNGELSLVDSTLSGIYNSRIAYVPYTPFNYLYFNESTITGTNAEVSVHINDPVPTMEARSSNTKPLNFAQFREMTQIYQAGGSYGYVWVRYKDRYIETEDIYFESGNLGCNCSTWFSSYTNPRAYRQYVDISMEDKDNFSYIVYYWPLDPSTNEPLSGNKKNVIFIGKYVNGISKCLNVAYGYYWSGSIIMSTNFRFTALDKNGGAWYYFYFKSNDVRDHLVLSSGYHFIYYTNGFSRTIHTHKTSTDFIHRLSLDYENDHIWYESISANSVIKLDNTNTILASYSSEIDGLNGIAALPDGGCWFANKTKLIRLDSNGNKIDETETGIVNIIDIELDGDDALWVANTEGIRRIFTDSREHFFVPLTTVYTIKATDLGLWVQCNDATIKYIKRDLQGIYKTLDKYRGMVGPMDIEVGGKYNGELFPVPHDTYWNNLEWNKVAIEGYMLPEHYYHQARLTLRPSDAELVCGFTDDFSAGGGNWTTLAGSVEYSLGYMRLYSDGAYAQTINNIDFGIEWETLFRMKNHGGGSASDIYLISLVLNGNSYLRIYMRTYSSSDNYVVLHKYESGAGTSLYTSNKYDYYNERGNWFWIKLRRSLNCLKFKIWKEGTTESDWDWIGFTLEVEDFPTTGKIRANSALTSGDGCGLDDILVFVHKTSSWQPPKVKNLHVVKNVVLEDIEPSNSKDMYLKVSVNDVPRGQSYDSNLRVGWSLPLT